MSEKKKFNIFDHELVPNHVLLNKKEAEDILVKYQVKAYQLPHIRISDPAAREIKANIGDIIKIIRKSQTMGEAITYRYVIEG